ncbi:MAG: hypothetical protein ACK4UN_17640 [Limisphaerales bacterium]
MWIKLTEQELLEKQRRTRRAHFRAAAIVGVSAAVLVMFAFGWREAGEHGRLIVPMHQISSRIPLAILAGSVSAFIVFRHSRKRRMVICPRCESTQWAGGSEHCSCGTRFEDLESMKYVA